jgi:DHA3 family macrolide efflux protein-like MFS transporter
MRSFLFVWLGQMFSLLGTNISGFGLTVWAYEKTGSATVLSLVAFFLVTPMLIVSPLAGALVDRLNRKFMMMISDLASGIASLSLLILFLLGTLEIWHLYVASAFIGTFQAFQWPAYSAAISLLVPKAQLGRANGLISLAETGTNILAPIMAAALLGVVGLGGILTIDLVTLILAVSSLLIIYVPQPEVTLEGLESRGNLWKESLFGFTYIIRHPGLLGLQIVFLMGNFFSTIGYTLIAPMILARTGNNELILGTVNSIGAIGGAVGGLVMSAWGGTKRKVHGVLSGWGLSGIFSMLMGLSRSVLGWTTSEFLSVFMSPFVNASNQSIWQAKVAPDLQGRVFSIRRLIAWVSMPLATLVAGPLADKVMEPAMLENGKLASVFDFLVGVGPGSGMALIILFTGLGAALVGFGGYAFPVLRHVEVTSPDEEPIIPLESEPALSE